MLLVNSFALKTSPSLTVKHLLTIPQVTSAFRFFETNADATTEEQIRICSVPATPFGEQERAEYLSKKFSELGLADVEIDEEGNCLGLLKGASRSPLMVVSAHLDTVFSKDTDFTVIRRDNRLLGPGVADDGAGLAALLALAQVIQQSKFGLMGQYYLSALSAKKVKETCAVFVIFSPPAVGRRRWMRFSVLMDQASIA